MAAWGNALGGWRKQSRKGNGQFGKGQGRSKRAKARASASRRKAQSTAARRQKRIDTAKSVASKAAGLAVLGAYGVAISGASKQDLVNVKSLAQRKLVGDSRMLDHYRRKLAKEGVTADTPLPYSHPTFVKAAMAADRLVGETSKHNLSRAQRSEINKNRKSSAWVVSHFPSPGTEQYRNGRKHVRAGTPTVSTTDAVLRARHAYIFAHDGTKIKSSLRQKGWKLPGETKRKKRER